MPSAAFLQPLALADVKALRHLVLDSSVAGRASLNERLKAIGLTRLGDRQRAINQLNASAATTAAASAPACDSKGVASSHDPREVAFAVGQALGTTSAVGTVRNIAATPSAALPSAAPTAVPFVPAAPRVVSDAPAAPDDDLSAEQCTHLLIALLEAYREPMFLVALEALQVRRHSNGMPRSATQCQMCAR